MPPATAGAYRRLAVIRSRGLRGQIEALHREHEEGTDMSEVEEGTRQALAGLSAGKLEALEGTLGLREEYRAATGLDDRTFALVGIAALIALDAPPASYAWQVASAVEVGVRAEDILGVLRAVAPQVGGPRVVAAAPEIMLALGLSLPENGGS
jgi:4-carboxymuconolactone decarboxylase